MAYFLEYFSELSDGTGVPNQAALRQYLRGLYRGLRSNDYTGKYRRLHEELGVAARLGVRPSEAPPPPDAPGFVPTRKQVKKMEVAVGNAASLAIQSIRDSI